jgi:hypothetical protein
MKLKSRKLAEKMSWENVARTEKKGVENESR